MIAPAYRNKIYVNDNEIELSTTEYDVLYFLMEYRGKTLHYEQIYKSVWKEVLDDAGKKALIAAVKRLRKSLGKASWNSDIIENIHDVGSRFRTEK